MNGEYDELPGRQGRWSKDEQNLFNFAFEWHGKDWKKLAEIITTRNIVQIRSHAQKYCKKYKEKNGAGSQIPKVYVLESSFEALNSYISTTCSRSYKKYMGYQQNLMYAQISQTEYEPKLQDNSIKIELNHN
ncbi:hypothetical protein SteCoe_18601 [Stentor coeruleus]|uniref:HTH myb-type domain-containing protein n=1 Tax=Stentor coeruleus TaxID=5963 RepID=A0A1R2BW68_9CILI|nr:hypothetical protein SteCoe_18601 [Stentor coeruleus]